jgi:hypothetical protein
MISALEKVDCVRLHQIHEPMFLRDSPRPDTGTESLQWLGLALTAKRVSHDCFNQTQHAECDPSILFDPIREILAEFRFKDR